MPDPAARARVALEGLSVAEAMVLGGFDARRPCPWGALTADALAVAADLCRCGCAQPTSAGLGGAVIVGAWWAGSARVEEQARKAGYDDAGVAVALAAARAWEEPPVDFEASVRAGGAVAGGLAVGRGGVDAIPATWREATAPIPWPPNVIPPR